MTAASDAALLLASNVVRPASYCLCRMAASKQAKSQKVRMRQFVVRLAQPGLYDRLLRYSLRRSREEGRRVPMTSLSREAFEEYLDRRNA